jgi:hypothetical protein
MTKRILLAGVVATSLLLLPIAIGDFAVVAPAHAIAQVPEPGTLALLTVGLVGRAALRWRRRR